MEGARHGKNALDLAMESIGIHLNSLNEDHPTTVFAPSQSQQHSRNFLYRYILCFLRLADNQNIYPFWCKSDFCGICLLLDPQQEIQARLLPYLLTAYIYNARHNDMIKKYLDETGSGAKEKVAQVLKKRKILFGQDLENYPKDDASVISCGIGHLYNQEAVDEDVLPVLNHISGFFRFYTPRDFENGVNKEYRKLKMICWPDGTFRYDDVIAPDEACIRRDLKRIPKADMPKSNRPTPLYEHGYSHYRRDIILRTICLLHEAMLTTLELKEFKNSLYPIAQPDSKLMTDILSPIITWRPDPTPPDKKPFEKFSGPQVRYLPALFPENFCQYSWPIKLNVSKLGYKCKSCTIIPFFGYRRKELDYLSECQKEYIVKDTSPTVILYGEKNVLRIQFELNSNVIRSSDLVKYRGEVQFDLTEIPEDDDVHADFSEIEKPYDTDTYFKFKLNKLYYGYSYMHLFFFYDLPEERQEQIIQKIKVNQRNKPLVNVQVFQTGLVSIQVYPYWQIPPHCIDMREDEKSEDKNSEGDACP